MAAQVLQLAIIEAWRELDAWVVGEVFDGDSKAAWKCMKALHAHVVVHGLAQPTTEELRVQATNLVEAAADGLGNPTELVNSMRRFGIPGNRTVEVTMAACRGDVDAVTAKLAGPFAAVLTRENSFDGLTDVNMPIPIRPLVAVKFYFKFQNVLQNSLRFRDQKNLPHPVIA